MAKKKADADNYSILINQSGKAKVEWNETVREDPWAYTGVQYFTIDEDGTLLFERPEVHISINQMITLIIMLAHGGPNHETISGNYYSRS